jgi:mRNA-degrading endonuclease RelE of RelBE toxin-antitoxin system
MKSFWKVSRHFAERVLKRVDENPKHFMAEVKTVLNEKCLQMVFDCLVLGNSGRRFVINDYVVCYEFDDTKQLLVLKTVFKR